MDKQDAIRNAMTENLSGLTLSGQRQREMMNDIIGGKPVKKKFSIGLVLAVVLMMASVAALAWGLTYSPKVSSERAARAAVMAKYGMAREAMDMFGSVIEETESGTVVRLYDQSESPDTEKRMGVYTVVIRKDGSAETAWSHDDKDKTVWSGTDLSAEAWGSAQILAYRDSRDAQWRALADQWQESYELPKATAVPYGKMTYAQALDTANRALKETFSLDDEMLTLFEADGALGEVSYGEHEDGVWGFVYTPTDQAYLVLSIRGDCPLGEYTVNLLDETGEILDASWSLSGVETGAFTKSTFGQAKALDAALMPYALRLMRDVAPIRERNYDMPGAWSVEDSAAYDALMRSAGYDKTLYNHVLPGQGDITYREAVNLTAQVLEKEYGVSRDVFDKSGFAYADLTDEGDHREWYFWVQSAEAQCGWSVVFNAQTGEVLFIGADPWAQGNG